MSELNLTHSNGNKVKLTTPDTLAASKTFKLPGTDGSEGQVLQTDGSGALSFSTVSDYSNRNLIINGACFVAQRGQQTGRTDGFGGPDRFRFQSNYSAVTMSQSTDVPTGQGFAKSLKLDVTTAGGDSNASTYTQIDYRFEGQELARLKYGTSSAETTTLSFWIKSPKAGTHWVRLYGDELSNGGAAFISRKYTVSSANTWQKVSLSFPGFTSDGFNNDNTTGMRISWYFAQGSDYSSGTAQADDGGWLNWADASDRARNTVGQVNCFDSTSNDIFITGVQYEVGSLATPFEHRHPSMELLSCQRYFKRMRGAVGGGSGYGSAGDGVVCTMANWTSSASYGLLPLGVEMRYAPKLTGFANLNYFSAGNTWAPGSSSQCYLAGSSYDRVELTLQGFSMTQGHAGWLRIDNTNGYMDFEAELDT